VDRDDGKVTDVPSYDELRADALGLFEELATAARRAGAGETLRRLTAARDRLADSRLTVVVCGEFKRGKSTLLNALLDQEIELFPTGISYTTSIVTTVEHGKTERIIVRRAASAASSPGSTADGGGQAAAEVTITRDQLRAYVTQDGNPGNGERVLGVEIALPSPLLASGLALIDTPGIGGVYAEHSLATEGALPLADVIVFVANAHQPLTGSEVRFLRRAVEIAGVGDDRDALICVLTRIDQELDFDEIVADTRAKLADATGWPAIPVVPVSSQTKLAYLSTHDSLDLEDSNFPAFEHVLWEMLARRRARAVLGGALADLDRSAAVLLEPVEAELNALRASGPDAAVAVRKAVEDRRRDLAGLGVAAATWRGDLRRESADLAGDVLDGALAHAARARRNVPGYLASDDLIDHPDKILQRVDEDVSAVTGIADRLLYDQAVKVQHTLAGQLGLTLGGAELRRLPPAPVPVFREVDQTISAQAGTSPPGTGPAGTQAGRVRLPGMAPTLSIGSTVGSVLGRVIGVVVASAAGGLVGGVIGAGAGLVIVGAVRLTRWRDPDSAERKLPRGERRKLLHADLEQYFTQVLPPYLTEHVTAVADEWAANIATEIDGRIRQEEAAAAEAAKRLSEPAPRDAERAAAREAALEAEQSALVEVRFRVAELATEVTQLASYGAA
jgi:hypothetical protein